jgi:hypothetical protein
MAAIAGNAFATGENIVTSKAYVDNELSQKQNTISTGLVEFNNNEDYMLPAIVVTNAAGTALNGNTIGILDYPTIEDDEGAVSLYNDSVYPNGAAAQFDNFVPTVRAVANDLNSLWRNKQDTISTGLVEFNNNEDYMLPAIVATNAAGTALNGNTIGILDYPTVRGDEGGLDMYNDSVYPNGAAEQFDNFVPTVRAVGNALRTVWNNMYNFATLPWNTAEQNATNAYSTTFAASGTNVWPSADANVVVKGETFANALALKQNKIPANSVRDVSKSLISTGNAAGDVTQTGLVTVTDNNYYWVEFASGDHTTAEGDALVPSVSWVVNNAQAKKYCAGWPDSVAVGDRTDANCWLWTFPD